MIRNNFWDLSVSIFCEKVKIISPTQQFVLIFVKNHLIEKYYYFNKYIVQFFWQNSFVPFIYF